jgi:hypothetical protein
MGDLLGQACDGTIDGDGSLWKGEVGAKYTWSVDVAEQKGVKKPHGHLAAMAPAS